MQTLTLDFETYWDSVYSLTKMTTIEYILDSRFEILCMSAKINGEETELFDGHKECETFLNAIDWENTILIGHNLLFDGGVLAYIFQLFPKAYCDTASMARVVLNFLEDVRLESVCTFLELEEKNQEALVNVKGLRRKEISKRKFQKLGTYCIGDTDKSYAVFKLLDRYLPEEEYELIDITISMFTKPQLYLNSKALKKFIQRLSEEREKFIEESGLTKTQLRSTPKLIEALKLIGIDEEEIPTKENPKQETIFTFEKDNVGTAALKVHPNPLVRKIIRARLNIMSSIEMKRAKRFLDVYNVTGGLFPIPLLHARAHTGRWAGTDKLNAQNIPKGPLRACVIAPPHHVVCVADLGQIEARITAWLAEHLLLLEQFADPNIDVYIEFAAILFSMAAEELYEAKAQDISTPERFVGKTCVLGLGFGMGWKRLLAQMSEQNPEIGMTREDAINAVTTYRHVNAPIKMLWKTFDNIILQMGTLPEGQEKVFKCLRIGREYIKLPSGRNLMYPDLRIELQKDENGNIRTNYEGEPYEEWVYTHRGKRTRLWGGHLTENVAQALARDIIGNNIRKIHKFQPVATTTHDEIITVPHMAYAEKVFQRMVNVMTQPPSWAPDLPLEAEGGYNEQYTK